MSWLREGQSYRSLYSNTRGQPLTVTDPNMTRFMMNLDGAVGLVLFAFQHANPGDRFVQRRRGDDWHAGGGFETTVEADNQSRQSGPATAKSFMRLCSPGRRWRHARSRRLFRCRRIIETLITICIFRLAWSEWRRLTTTIPTIRGVWMSRPWMGYCLKLDIVQRPCVVRHRKLLFGPELAQ